MIYEGDRINNGEEIFEVYFCDNVLQWRAENKKGVSSLWAILKDYDTEVIGNIYTDKKKSFGSTFEALEWLVNNRDKEIIFRFKDEDNDDIHRYRFSDISEEFEYRWKTNGEWSGWSKDSDNSFKCPECWFDIMEY